MSVGKVEWEHWALEEMNGDVGRWRQIYAKVVSEKGRKGGGQGWKDRKEEKEKG